LSRLANHESSISLILPCSCHLDSVNCISFVLLLPLIFTTTTIVVRDAGIVKEPLDSYLCLLLPFLPLAYSWFDNSSPSYVRFLIHHRDYGVSSPRSTSSTIPAAATPDATILP